MFADSCLMVTQNIGRTVAPQFATSPIKARRAVFLTLFAMITRLAVASPVPRVAFQRVFFHALTLLRAASSEGPPGTGKVAEAPVEPGVTQAGSVESVAIAVVGTVAPFVAVLPKETFRATVGAELAVHAGRAAALPRGGVAGASVLALANAGTASAVRPGGASFVTDNAGPPR